MAPSGQWSLGFWNSLGSPSCPISSLDMQALTHISHWAALVGADGSLNLNYHQISADAPELIHAAHAKGIKVLLTVVNPYWLDGRDNFTTAVENHRAVLLANIMSVVNQYSYDGVDIDWEGSPPNLAQLAPDLRAHLGTRLLAADAIVTDYRYWGAVEASLDRINVMTYDLTGGWNNYSWHNAALYGPVDQSAWSVDLAVRRYTANGVPASKLGIGIPFYGYQWSGGGITAPNQTIPVTPSLSQINYNVLARRISPSLYNWDSFARVPYLSFNAGIRSMDQFLTYDNERSIAEKVQYARNNQLGGWIIWNLQGDYFPGAAEEHPLLKAVKDAMGVAAPLPADNSLPKSKPAGRRA
jgi:chitinase